VDKIVDASSPREASIIRADLIKKEESDAAPVGKQKISDFASSWLKLKSASVTSYTLEGYRYALEDQILQEIGDYFYDALTHADVQACVNRLLEKLSSAQKRYSVESVRDWFRVFRNMTHDAIVQLRLSCDPTMRIKFPDHNGEQIETKEEVTLTIDELRPFLAAMRKRPASLALAKTLGYTGLRFCHASALKWGDLDFETLVIHVRRKQVRGVVGPISRKKPAPKELPMMPELAETLEAHRQRLERLVYATGADDWVFPSTKGTLRTPASLVNAFTYSLAEAGIEKRITPHKLRYFFNDALRLAGVDAVTGKSLTGHVTNQMRERYSTVRLEEKRAAMEAVREALSPRKVGTKVGTVVEMNRAG
jgi:integrase